MKPPKSGKPRHFLDLDRLDGGTLRHILAEGAAYKADPQSRGRPLAGKTLAMIFEKPSTRTRVSFEVGMRQLGGEVVVLGERDSQLGRGESVADTARVLSRFVDIIMIRTDAPEKLEELAANARVPVINGLTDASHPCQILADVMTLEERLGAIGGKCVAWVGDGNNVAASWLHAAVRLDFSLRVATPPELGLPAPLLAWAQDEGARVSVHTEADEAVAGADCVVTDTWVSMGDDAEHERRLELLSPFRVDGSLMAGAAPHAIFLHCLPAHRGEEVTDEVIDGPQSAVWDEAENRLHVQKGVLAWCLEDR